jgi:hypothetical protein
VVEAVTETAYQKLRRGPGRPREYPPAVAKARRAEQVRRSTEARRRALMVLAARHPDEFDRLLAAERDGLDTEKGPLPGDPEA